MDVSGTKDIHQYSVAHCCSTRVGEEHPTYILDMTHVLGENKQCRDWGASDKLLVRQTQTRWWDIYHIPAPNME